MLEQKQFECYDKQYIDEQKLDKLVKANDCVGFEAPAQEQDESIPNPLKTINNSGQIGSIFGYSKDSRKGDSCLRVFGSCGYDSSEGRAEEGYALDLGPDGVQMYNVAPMPSVETDVFDNRLFEVTKNKANFYIPTTIKSENNQTLKFWRGTQEEYEEISHIDSDTLYIIVG